MVFSSVFHIFFNVFLTLIIKKLSTAKSQIQKQVPSHSNFIFNFLQGITLKMNELNHCIVARIMHGGMIHRQGKFIYDSFFPFLTFFL